MKRTTIRFEEETLRRLKEKAAREGRTLQDVTNDLLRQALDERKRGRQYRFGFVSWEAELLPGVDICDRRTLFDIMEER